MVVSFQPSQKGGQAPPPEERLSFTDEPMKLLWFDTTLFFQLIWYLPNIILPMQPCGSGNLDELHLSPANLWAMFLHLLLIILQLGFLFSLPFCIIFPVWSVIIYTTAVLLTNSAICKLLNGSHTSLMSTTPLQHRPEHDSERWIFLNGVAVGQHWLQSNIDRLSLTFGRSIQGVHNPTSGIIFDILQCLIQRNFGYATSDVRVCHRLIKAALYDPTFGKVVLILHSQGGIEGGLILDWLLAEVPQDLMQQLEVYTFGNAASHFSNPHRRLALLDAAPPTKGFRSPNSKAIRHVEHYANSGDFVARWGVLHFTSYLPQERSADRFMGRVFERPGGGHQFCQHYLDNMFPLDSRPGVGAAETNAFMEMEIKVGGNDEVQNAREALEVCVSNAELVVDEVAVVRDLSSPVTPLVATFAESEVEEKRTLRVRDLSRLWAYRNGQSPREEGKADNGDRVAG